MFLQSDHFVLKMWIELTNPVKSLFFVVMNAMTAEDYKETYWPRLENAVEQLLTQSPVQYTSISYEQIYRLVIFRFICSWIFGFWSRDIVYKTLYLFHSEIGLGFFFVAYKQKKVYKPEYTLNPLADVYPSQMLFQITYSICLNVEYLPHYWEKIIGT